MDIDLLPQPTVASDHPGPEHDGRPALQASTARVGTDQAGMADPVMGDSPVDEREWYPPPGSPCM
jgi:hypothetical protein